MSRGRVDPETGLTLRQAAFARAYAKCGNAAQSAREAGYSPKHADQQGRQLLTSPKHRAVQAYIRELAAETECDDIASLAELRAFWTTALRDPEVSMKDRLKASDLMGKSLGAFIDRVDSSGELVVRVVRE